MGAVVNKAELVKLAPNMTKTFFLQFKENCDAVQLRADTLCTFYRLASAEFDELEAMEKNKPWFNKWYEGRDESGQVR